MTPRVLSGTLACLALVLFGSLLFIGATRADPDVAAGRPDLEVLRQWVASGVLSDNSADPSHLTKAGYLLYLRATLPHAGADEGENRRFLLLNAGWILLGVASAAGALGRRFGSPASLFFLLGILACPAVRDCADYVTSEPITIGLSLLVAAVLVAAPSRSVRPAILVGVAAGLIALLRPNTGAVVLLIAFLTASAGPKRMTSILVTTGGFAACLGVLWMLSHTTHLPLAPLGGESSRVILWGTADYYWKPDVGGWPVGATPQETARLQITKAKQRWSAFLHGPGESRNRSLLWRVGHGLLSTEELPPRWRSARYAAADRLGRKWWWALAAAIVGASAGAAIAGRNEWRFVPAAVLAACIGQSLLFGADPRLNLPFLPLILLGLAAALPTARPDRRAVAGAVLGAAAVVLLCIRVPDVAAFDFARIAGPRHSIEQTIPASAFPPAGSALVHFRLLQEPPLALGFSVFGNGALILRRDPGDTSPWPASFRAALGERGTDLAGRKGLRIRIEIEGSDPSGGAFVYYPVVPPALGGRSAIDGREEIPSGFGETTEGGLPVWITRDTGDPRAKSSSVKAGKSVSTRRR
ncbi:MAG TPA: hypothetical protein VMT25_05685, partial [Thermoanaerobaculia bacterium]|nr:hypothetical protein [Thermoanaerobaculia bacterium]